MSNLINKSLRPAGAFLIALTALASHAADEAPIISITSSAYSYNGSGSQFSILIGGYNEDGDDPVYIDVDYGDGILVEEELLPGGYSEDSTGDTGITWTGTFLNIPAIKENQQVKIYGDASKVFLLSASGIYATAIDIAAINQVAILDLSHNYLENLDLSGMSTLSYLDVSDNPFTGTQSLKIGPNKPYLEVLEMAMIDNIDQSFNLSDYPRLGSFVAYSNRGLKTVDPTGCPYLAQISIDSTPVESIDVSKNAGLVTLNVSDTKINAIDVSNNSRLTHLYVSHAGSSYAKYKLTELDISKNTALTYLACGYNDLTELDISNCPSLNTLYAQYNYLSKIDISNNPALYRVDLSNNCFGFADLPLDPGTWNEYYYNQRPIAVDRSYAVGTPIDLKSKVIRSESDSQTYARVMTFSADNPYTVTEVAEDLYTYADGVVTFNSALKDSVYVEFANSHLAEYSITTSNFMVKDEADFGKPLQAAVIGTLMTSGSTFEMFVGIDGADSSTPKSFGVDFGDGNVVDFTATSSLYDGSANISKTLQTTGYITVYVPEGSDLSSLVIKDMPLTKVDVGNSHSLRELTLDGCQLYEIDLSTNRILQSLNLDNNNLSTLNLAGSTTYNTKNSLTSVSARNNKLTSIDITDLGAIIDLDLSNNLLESMRITSAELLKSINLSNNKLTAIDFSRCYVIESINFENNSVVAFMLPTENPIRDFHCAGNGLTLLSLPAPSRFAGAYTYAPQADIVIPSIGPGADLSEQYRDIDGNTTRFTWKKADGSVLVEGTDITCNNGTARFLKTDLGMIYCEVSHPSFPDFTGADILKTTQIETADMPTNVVAEFTTTADETASLSLAAATEGTSLFIDWKGTGVELEQYTLHTDYTLFSAYTYKDADVKVYSYDPKPDVTVFSISGASMSSFDGSKLEKVTTFSLKDAGLESITLPPNTEMKELNLGGNKLSSIDLSAYSNLVALSLNDNNFEGEFDLSRFPDLLVAGLAYNNLSGVKLDNPQMYQLDLSANNISSIDLNGAPALTQVSLSQNNLSQIDVSMLKNLLALALTSNKFTFKTLPTPLNQYSVYNYANQADVEVECTDGKVDLSSVAELDGSTTEYRWFVGKPVYNEDTLELEGEELEADSEFTVENGTTSFNVSLDGLVGVMTNSTFPNLTLYTLPIDVTSGITAITADGEISVSVEGNSIVIDAPAGKNVRLFNISGMSVRETIATESRSTLDNLANGVYVLTVGNNAFKLAIK